MKNYNLYKKCLSVFFAISIVVFSFYQSYFTSYAKSENSVKNFVADFGNDLLKFLETFGNTITYATSQVGALVSGDFEKWLLNNEKYKDYWKDKYLHISDDLDDDTYNKDNYITINKYTNEINYSEDFLNDIKQALLEYSEETNGYWLIPTNSVMEISPGLFKNRNNYITMQYLINNHGIVAFHFDSSGEYTATDISEYITSDYSLVSSSSSYNPYTSNSGGVLRVYNSNWDMIRYFDTYSFSYSQDRIFTDITEGSPKSGYSRHEYLVIDWRKGSFLNGLYTPSGSGHAGIISKDGCRLRVFKSENAMKCYDTGTRTVYFGTEFYEKDPTNITITIDDFEKYLSGDLDDYFKRLQNTIISQGQNLSEADVEKLTDSILKELHNINGSLGDLNESSGETNNLLSKILAVLENLDRNVASILSSLDDKVTSTLDFSGIEERLDTIIMSLGIISGQLDDMTVEEIESKTDNALKEMQNEFADIGELAKTKFPLSLPWDLGKAFDKISGGDITSGESPPESVAALLYDEPDKFVYTMSLYDDNGIALYASENTDSSQGGGYFPSMEFSVDSLRGTDNGGHISSGGQEHGGGGASRWGAWHSDTGAPIFYMPVEFSHNMKIGGMLIIDLSGFEVLHSIGRIMFSVIFCMNLVHLTFKAISAGKDLLTW